MLPNKLFFVVILALYSYAVKSQVNCPASLTHHSDSVKKWHALLQQRHLEQTQSFNGPYAEQKKVLYQEKIKFISEHFERPELVTDVVINQYIGSIMGRLQPVLKELTPPTINVYISRTGLPNAFTPGYHTVFLNAGLLTRLQNEAQLAFVLCHEIAHVYLKHNEQAADQYLSSIQSKAFRDEVAAIKKQDFGKGRAVQELSKKFSYDSRRHSRFKETAADSLAIVWLQRSGYRVNQAIDCLAILDSIDTDDCDTRKVFENHLSFAAYPVKPAYFGTARRSVFGAAAFAEDEQGKTLKDSLRTHPDCQQRMQYAGNMISNEVLHKGSAFLVDSVKFGLIKDQLQREQVNYALSSEKTSLGFFYVIRQLHEGSFNPSIAASISRSLQQLYEAQKNHVLGKTVDLPNPQLYSKSYNELLYFIQNATLKDLSNIDYLFTTEAVKKFPGCKQLSEAMVKACEHMAKPEEAAQWKKNAETL